MLNAGHLLRRQLYFWSPPEHSVCATKRGECRSRRGSPWGWTAFYIAHVYYFLARRIADRELMLSFMGLSVFLAVTIPLVLSREWITVISWAVQALVMLSGWPTSSRVRSFRQVAFLLYGIILFRFGFVDLAAQYSKAAQAVLPQVGKCPPR